MPSFALSTALRAGLFTLGILAATSAHALDPTLRLQGQWVNSNGNAFVLSGDFGSGPGAYLGVEFPLNDRFGIEAGVGWIDFDESEDVDSFILTSSVSAALTVIPVTVAFNVHLTPQKRYDFYLAPKIGWAFFDDLEVVTRFDFDFDTFPFPDFDFLSIVPDFSDQITTNFTTEDQFIFGLRLGFDVPFGDSSWSFSSSIDYTDMELEIEIPTFGGPVPGVDLEPLSIGVGVAYSF